MPKLPSIEPQSDTLLASADRTNSTKASVLTQIPELESLNKSPDQPSEEAGQNSGEVCAVSVPELEDEDPIDPFADVDVERELGPYIQDIPDVFKRDRQGNIINPYNVQAEDLLPTWSTVGKSYSAQDTAEFPKITTTLDSPADPLLTDEPKAYMVENSIPQKMSGIQKFLLFILVLIIAGLAYLVFLLATHQLEVPRDWMKDMVPPEVSSKQEEASPAIQAPERKPDSSPQAILEDLNRNYVDIGSMNERISGVVDDFNSWFQISNAEKRQYYAKQCSDLLNEIVQAKDEFNKGMKERGVVFGTPYYDQAQAIDELYDNLQRRTQVLNDAWQRSAQSENPVADSSYILEPIAQANSSGNSQLISDFNREYPNAMPHAVEEEAH